MGTAPRVVRQPLIDRAGLNKPMSGEVALVTGAGRGIGREAALAIARLGAMA